MTTRSRKHLYILPDLAGGGAERVAIDLLRHLPSAGVDVDLLLVKDVRDYDTDVLSDAEVFSLLKSTERIRSHLHKLLPRLVRVAARYDVLIAGLELWPSYVTAVVGKLLRKKVVSVVHVALSEYIEANRLPVYHRHLTRVLSFCCDQIITVSHGAKKDLVDKIGIPERRIEVIHDPHDIEDIQRLAGEHLSEEEQEFYSKPVIVSAGRMSIVHKGFDILLRAFKSVLDEGLDCNLHLLGKGADYDTLRRLADDLGISARVAMPGFKANPYKYMACATVFVLPSRFEGFGKVLVEAMACGCPVISTDCPSGPAEILDGGKYGVLVRTGDEADLARALVWLLSDGAERRRLGQLGIDRAKCFGAVIVANRYAEVLASL